MEPGRTSAENLEIRLAVASDVAAIVRIVNLAYQVEAFFIEGERTDAAEIGRLLARGAFLVAERHGAMVGSVFVEDRGDHGYIGLVSVEPALQSAGIGRVLMDAAERRCSDAGHPRVELLVVDLRSELPPWYRRLGYRVVATRPFPAGAPIRRPCAFLVMSKRLGPVR